jgi:ABC-type polysaccharide/polyol phosphate transport system ATPase subunit
MGIAIRVSDLTKVYERYSHRKQFRTLKSALLGGSLLQDLKPDERFPALTGVTFNVREGSTFAVIGRNGSGKSTLLKVIAGISKPSSGTVTVNGRISALIELGAGFHPEITGRENIFINGIMLGLTKKEIQNRFDDIVQFAELEDFIDAPVKTYSSGMYMRLGFAVAIHVDPDILLIDEVLAVGDEAFVHKCLDKISELRRRNKTILLVTHSLGLVEKMADEALWIRRKSSMLISATLLNLKRDRSPRRRPKRLRNSGSETAPSSPSSRKPKWSLLPRSSGKRDVGAPGKSRSRTSRSSILRVNRNTSSIPGNRFPSGSGFPRRGPSKTSCSAWRSSTRMGFAVTEPTRIWRSSHRFP